MNTQLKTVAALTMTAVVGFTSNAMAGSGGPAPKPKLVCIDDGAAYAVNDDKECPGKIRRVGKHRGGAHIPACEGKPAGATVSLSGNRIAVCRG